MKLRLELSYVKHPWSPVYVSLTALFDDNYALKQCINIFFEDPENVELLNKNDFDKLAREWADGSIFNGRAPHYIVDLFLNFLVLCGIDVILDSNTIDDLAEAHMRLISGTNNKYSPWVEVV